MASSPELCNSDGEDGWSPVSELQADADAVVDGSGGADSDNLFSGKESAPRSVDGDSEGSSERSHVASASATQPSVARPMAAAHGSGDDSAEAKRESVTNLTDADRESEVDGRSCQFSAAVGLAPGEVAPGAAGSELFPGKCDDEPEAWSDVSGDSDRASYSHDGVVAAGHTIAAVERTPAPEGASSGQGLQTGADGVFRSASAVVEGTLVPSLLRTVASWPAPNVVCNVQLDHLAHEVRIKRSAAETTAPEPLFCLPDKDIYGDCFWWLGNYVECMNVYPRLCPMGEEDDIHPLDCFSGTGGPALFYEVCPPLYAMRCFLGRSPLSMPRPLRLTMCLAYLFYFLSFPR